MEQKQTENNTTNSKKQFNKKRSFGGRRPHDKRRPAWPKKVEMSDGFNDAQSTERKTAHIPDPEPGVVRIIPLGGVEEIGKNMTVIEYGDDIIVVDAGMYFSNESTPGIDYVIPNTRYLEERKDKIRALIVTHGHLDHIGGVPIVLSRIGNPPVYSRNLSILLMRKRQSEFPHLPALNAITVEKDQVITLGNLRVRFWGVTHTIPDSMGIIIETPYGNIINPGDYKLDQIEGVVSESEEKEYKQFDASNNLLLMTDSTNIENEGFALAEVKVHQGIENILRREKNNRIFMAAFASHITRLIRVVQIAEELGKKVVLEGRSMKTNIEIAIQAGILKPKKDTIIPLDEIDKYPPDKLLILITGAQGEEYGGLNRLANKTNKKLALRKGDRIILSASIIPGNERQIEKMKDGLARQGVKIISYRTPGEEEVHATGHGNKEDIKWLHNKIHEKFFIPIHGNHYRLVLHKELAMTCGIPEDHIIVPDNGSIIEIIDNGTKMVVRKEKAPASPMMVDGFSVGDEQNVVIRDRQMLAEDGMFVVMALLDSKTGLLKKSPDIISRGFVYLKESQELVRHTRALIKRTIEQETKGQMQPNIDQIKNIVADTVSKYLFQQTAKSPLVLPVILTV
ncbi:MAG TPA: ribonuclease J [Candidatus Paceibacterota bacterium]|jgi:ribonuclease J|nr:ribonuclease J [Candidatus Paceibacterota bacterium]